MPIFCQLNLGFDMEPEIQILKAIYCTCTIEQRLCTIALDTIIKAKILNNFCKKIGNNKSKLPKKFEWLFIIA
jgi:hypothetical protein